MKIGTAKAVAAILLALVLLALAQGLSMLIGNIPAALGAPAAIGNILTGVLYPSLTFLGIKLLCAKLLRLPLARCKLPRFSLKPLWCAVALLMPCLVSAILLATAGHWENSPAASRDAFGAITGAIFFYGLGAGLVEEMIFRGVIMSALEYRWNKYVAVIFPSVLFGLLHIIGNNLDALSTIQLLVAGSAVGVLFSLVAYEGGNVWNSAVIHGVWNMLIIGGILHIGDAADRYSLLNYVLDTDSFFITGGDFGVEASAVAVAAYVAFSVLALLLLKRQKRGAGSPG